LVISEQNAQCVAVVEVAGAEFDECAQQPEAISILAGTASTADSVAQSPGMSPRQMASA
jgi:hypothetical protein